MSRIFEYPSLLRFDVCSSMIIDFFVITWFGNLSCIERRKLALGALIGLTSSLKKKKAFSKAEVIFTALALDPLWEEFEFLPSRQRFRLPKTFVRRWLISVCFVLDVSIATRQ